MTFDINEFEAFTEVDEFDPNADMSDAPPPPPERAEGYMAVPTLVPYEGGKLTKVGADSVGRLQVDWVIQDEGQRWHKAKIRTWPSAVAGAYAQISEIDQIIKAYTGKAATGASRGQKMQFIAEKLQAQEPLRIVIQWVAEKGTGEIKNGREKTKVVKRGMNRFPQSESGAHLPTFEDSDGEVLHATAKIVTYKPLA